MRKTLCQICNSDDSTEICRVDDHEMLFCKHCRNGRTYPPPSDFDYTDEDFHGRNVESDVDPSRRFQNLPREWRESIQIQVDLLKRNLPEKASILEIGCGEGILLHQLALNEFNVSGIEPGKSASERARAIGLNVTTGHFPEDCPPGPFDAIILSHVLEHLEKPGEVLRELATRNPKAIILLAQTNFQGLIPRIRKHKWYAWAPEQHFWHFSEQGITHISRNEGFLVRSVTYSSLCHQPLFHRILNLAAFFIPTLYDQMHVILAPMEQR